MLTLARAYQLHRGTDSITDLAGLIGVTKSKLSHWLSGRYSNELLLPEQVKLLAQSLNCRPGDIADTNGRPLVVANVKSIKGKSIYSDF